MASSCGTVMREIRFWFCCQISEGAYKSDPAARAGGGKLTAELLQPDELAAGVLTQLAAEPLLRHVLAGFMASHRGPTIRTHSAAK